MNVKLIFVTFNFRGDADILTLDFPKSIESEDQIVQLFEEAAIR